MGDYVVLFHGIFRTSRHMRKLAAFLKHHHYDVINLDYPSTSAPLDILIDDTICHVRSAIREHKPVHFVGYSMGGLMVRGILSRYRPDHMGKAVMLAPPNQGSEIADWLQNNYLYKRLYGPAGQQLTTDQSGISHLFKTVDYDCGVIAGDLSLDPICSYFIKGKNDGKVSVESTKLEGMRDHIILHSCHTLFPHNKDVQRQTLHFIRHGTFQRER